MKRLIFILFCIIASNSEAQSSSNQMGSLLKSIDSLTNVINSERSKNQAQVKELMRQLAEKEEEIRILKTQLGINSNVKNTEQVKAVEKVSKTYEFVQIGTQHWMKKNLDVENFRNGDVIQQAKTTEEWILAGKQGIPAWCYYNNDEKNGEKYGKLYNWFAVSDPRGLAPIGWKIPEFEDLNILDTYLWGDVGIKMKSNSGWNSWNVEERCKTCINWDDEQRKGKLCSSCNNKRLKIAKTNSGNGNNSSGFYALPGGFRNPNGDFEKIGEQINFWSSSPQFTLYGRYRYLSNIDNELIMNYATKDFGMSIRCLKE